jgi:signal transduction histidine kinase
MILSGVILTYLSINSISNFKELTEKKANEEQLQLASRLSADFGAFLERTADDFRSQISNTDITNGFEYTGYIPGELIKNTFVADSLGILKIPWNVEGIAPRFSAASNPNFELNFLTGQQHEYQENDLGKASWYYNRSLAYASSPEDSVNSINSLARVLMKRELYSESQILYSKIITDYPSQLSNAGFPIAYYGILNLLEIAIQNDSILIYPEVMDFLSGIARGSIPYNNWSEDILQRIDEWREHDRRLIDDQNARLESEVEAIRNNIFFINTYSELIKSAVQSMRSSDVSPVQAKYEVIPASSVDSGNTLIIFPDHGIYPGFHMKLEDVWFYFLKETENLQTEFAYDIDLLGTDQHLNLENERLVTYHVLSTWFPEFEICISLSDPDLIDNYVMKRQWSYAIALILLLGAMLIGILLILRDIMRERRLAQLRSDFVSNVSHELKTPLTSIYLYTESVLAGRVTTEKGKNEYLNIILRETERLKRMINNILDFSKKEKGKIQYKKEQVNLTGLIQSALGELDYWLHELEFKMHIQLEDNVILKGDGDALKQVIINLLDNAIKYSDKEKEISVNLEVQHGRIVMSFSDKGMGIPADQLDAVFEKFYRVQDPIVEGIGGTGLGLTVVREIVEVHEGFISVDSEPGKGSTFTVILKHD